jgi:Trk K+ transport system NAD-binding subunit
MALNQSSEALRRPLGALRVSFPLVAAVSLVLGYAGFGQYLPAHPAFAASPIDRIYYDLQLFVLGADPMQEGGSLPVLLQIARFTAPAVSLYALFEAGRMLFSVELSRWRARRARGHAIVCGDTAFADALTRTLQEEGTEVIEIRTQADDFVTAGEPLRIIGDARDPEVLAAAGLERADAVYACASGSATNAAIALAARRSMAPAERPAQARGPVPRGAPRAAAPLAVPLSVYSHIEDPDLCATFQAAFLGQRDRQDVRVDFFNIHQIAARRLFDDDPVVPVPRGPATATGGLGAPAVMVAGASGFAGAVVVAAARSWRVGRPAPWPLPVTLVGAGADAVIGDLTQRYPFLHQVCTFTTDETELLTVLASGARAEPPDRLVVCHRSEEYALKLAMAAERSWRGRVRSVVVRLDSLAPYLGPGLGADGAALLDAGAGVLRPFGVIAAACDPRLIREDLVERLAHVIHDRYRLGRRQRGEWVPGDPSLESWDRLSPRLRRANRAQAEDIGRKLAEVNCAISPRFSPDGDAVLSEADLEYLARSEHERWLGEQRDAGWQYAPERSDERKLHPGLRPWNALPAHFRYRCHDAVRELSDILADAGFRIVRG